MAKTTPWEGDNKEHGTAREEGALRTLKSQPAQTHAGVQICILIRFKILISKT